MKRSGLADSPFFTESRGAVPPTEAPQPTGNENKEVKRVPVGVKTKRKSTEQSTDLSTRQSTGRQTDPLTDRSIDRSIGWLVDIETLGPVVERPRAFYITEQVDRWLDEAVRYLKRKGLHKVDRSVLVNAILHNPALFSPGALDAMRARLLAHLTNKSLKRAESSD